MEIFGIRHEKTCFRRFANNKGAGQPAHPRSLISGFVIRLLESVIERIFNFLAISVADQARLNLTLSEPPKTGYLAARPNFDTLKIFLWQK